MATRWVQIDATTVEASLSDGELKNFRGHCAQLVDPLPEIVADVQNLCRGYLARRYALPEKGIPEELRGPCVDVVIYRLAKRVKLSGGEEDAQRKKAADDAVAIFKNAAAGEFGDFTTGATDPRSGSWGSKPVILGRM